MKKKLATWLTNIIRAELDRSETLAASELKRIEDGAAAVANDLKTYVSNEISAVKAHITCEVDRAKKS